MEQEIKPTWRSKNREKFNEYHRNYRRLKKIQHYAHTQVGLAVESGLLIKTPCVICGNVRVHGHHPDYKKPLQVVWLCAKHHKQVHCKKIPCPSIFGKVTRPVIVKDGFIIYSEEISIRANKHNLEIAAMAGKNTSTPRDAVVAGLYHVARICARCEQKVDCPFRSEGYPICTNCAETTGIKLDE